MKPVRSRLILFFLVSALLHAELPAQWRQTQVFPGAQNVLSMASLGPYIFCGTYGAGVYCSTNEGMTWTESNYLLADPDVYALTPAGGNLYAATDGGGVCVTTNNGSSWTTVNDGLTHFSVYALSVHASNVLAGTYHGGVFISPFTPVLWTASNAGLPVPVNRYWVTAFAVGSDDIFAALYGPGVYHSTNGGSSWSPANNGLITSGAVNTVFAFGGSLFAGFESEGIFRSTNNGASWAEADSGILGQWKYVRCFASRGTVLIAGTRDSGVFISTNNGDYWTPWNAGLLYKAINALAVIDTSVYAGTWYGGVWKRPVSQLVTEVNQGHQELPERLRLFQNCPNPFNPSTEIGYSIPVGLYGGRTSLRVFDVLGREVAILVNEVKQAGGYTVQWDASGFASGVYFYQLKTNQFIQTKKMILAK